VNEGTHTDPRIVVGVDGSPSSHQALLWAAHTAKLTGASLQVIACWESPTTEIWEIPPAFDSGDDARRSLEEQVAEVLDDDPGIDINVTVVEGQAAPVLLDAARGASLLVVGSRSHRGFTGRHLGSVSERCVTHAPCPVTVVRDVGDHDRGDPS